MAQGIDRTLQSVNHLKEEIVMTDEVQSSQNTDDHRAAFTREDAAKLIIAGVQSGTLSFPFSNGGNAKAILERIQKLREQNPTLAKEDVLTLYGKEVAFQVAARARLDAVYFLTLQQQLMTGLTQEEADRIRKATSNL